MINHILIIVDLKIFARNDNEVDSLVQAIQQCSTDISMEFGISTCPVVTLKRGRMVESRGIKLTDGEEMTEHDCEGYKYLGVLEIDTIMCSEMKAKVKDVYLRYRGIAEKCCDVTKGVINESAFVGKCLFSYIF